MKHSSIATNTESMQSKENFMLWCSKFATEHQYFQSNRRHTSENFDQTLVADFSAIKLLSETPRPDEFDVAS
jgi:hypothetical protein